MFDHKIHLNFSGLLTKYKGGFMIFGKLISCRLHYRLFIFILCRHGLLSLRFQMSLFGVLVLMFLALKLMAFFLLIFMETYLRMCCRIVSLPLRYWKYLMNFFIRIFPQSWITFLLTAFSRIKLCH